MVLQLLRRAEPRGQRVDAGGARPQAGEDARAARVAERGLAVGVGEGGAAGGELVDVRRLRLRVAAERADPVVQVVEGDEQDVGLLRGGRAGGVSPLIREDGCERENGPHGDFPGEPRPAGPLQ